MVFKIHWKPVLDSVGIQDPEKQKQISQNFAHFPPHHLFEKGLISEEEFLSELRSLLGIDCDDEKLKSAWNALIISPLEDIDQVFEKYKGKYAMYTLSNTNSLHMDHCFEQYDILQKFDGYCMSYELQCRKPELDIYIKSAQKAGVQDFKNCIFIDDTLENVEAARQAGFTAFHSVNSVKDTIDQIDHAIRRLS